ncbi:MAG TPA: sigma-70 family RNA polymerase sigma factor [Polyangiales bacterium]
MLFATYAGFVWRVLRRHGVPERDLEDACQEVFLVVHRRLGEFEGRSTLRTWLYAIAARVALGQRRKAHVKHERLSYGEHDAAFTEQPQAATQLDSAEQRQALALVEAALQTLDPDQREVFALYELESMTMAEVAGALDIPENTALYRLYAARDKLRAYVKRRSVAVPALREPRRAAP